MDKFLHEKYPATIGEDECEVEQQLGLGVSTYLQAMYIISILACTIGSLWLARLLTVLIKKRYTVTLQVLGGFGKSGSVEDNIYHALLKWLGKNIKGFQRKRLTTRTHQEKIVEDLGSTEDIKISEEPNKALAPEEPEKTDEIDSEEDSDEEFNYRHPSSDHICSYKQTTTLGYGTHYFRYKGALIKLERRILYPKVIANGSSQEILEFTTAKCNEPILLEMMEKSKPKFKVPQRDKIQIFKGIDGSHWGSLGGPKRKRPLNTIILDNTVIDRLLRDIRKFLTLEQWYVDRGIPYRRAYLLYGPPGCGKSSMIKSIAGEIGYDISILSLSQGVTDDSIVDLLNNAPKKSIILLEDIDAAFKSREDPTATSRETNFAFEGCSKSALTFRGLLNALDGVGSAEDGILIFMTTNYPERLDPALVRPGRVDYRVHIGYPNDTQLEKMFDRFYPEAEKVLRTKFVASVRELKDLKVSMAMVQGLFLLYKDEPEGALENVKDILENQGSSNPRPFTCLYM